MRKNFFYQLGLSYARLHLEKRKPTYWKQFLVYMFCFWWLILTTKLITVPVSVWKVRQPVNYNFYKLKEEMYFDRQTLKLQTLLPLHQMERVFVLSSFAKNVCYISQNMHHWDLYRGLLLIFRTWQASICE